MDPTLADLHLYYTGAGSNSNTALSIGGDISSVRVTSQSTTGLDTLSGVTIDDAIGNGVGAGTLTYTASTTSLTWQPFGGSVGTAVNVGTSGTYAIQGGSNGGALLITVVAASLPTNNVSNTITVANRTRNFFSTKQKRNPMRGLLNTTASLSKTFTLHCLLSVSNYGCLKTLRAPIQWRYMDPLAAGDGSTTSPTAVANENTAPAASTFVTPDSVSHADVLSVGTLTAGQVRFFWVRQLTPAGVSTKTTANTFKLGMFMRS